MKKHKEEYHSGKLRDLIETVAKMAAARPEIAKNLGILHTSLAMHVPGYDDRSKCYNCTRSMKITVYTADILDALLIMEMAKDVKKNLVELMAKDTSEMKSLSDSNFTEANKVYIPGLQTTQGILKRQTKCDYLGLIKQPEHWRGSGFWLLTRWAFKALRGEEIPKSAKYWEGQLIGRSDETTTLSEMFKTHTDLVENCIAKRKSIRSDYRSHFDNYNPSDWSDFGGIIE